jgi:lysozyme family protein
MAATNRMASFLATMKWEGGDRLSLDRRDPGNWTGGIVGAGALKGTKWGVAASAHPTLDIANLTAEQALAIFVAGYWSLISGDELPVGLDHCVSDDAYNAGPRAALRRLAEVNARTRGQSVSSRIDLYSKLRLSFLESLKSWRIFGRGWARRVAGVEAEALKMALSVREPPALSHVRVDSSAGQAHFLTPADAETIARTHVNLARASRNALASSIAIAIAASVSIFYRNDIAFGWFVLLGPVVAALLISRFWAWRVHAARRDALSACERDIARYLPF